MSRFNIECDTGYMHQDSGQWRSYELVASGNTLDELLADAHIFEIDQDGGSLGDYSLEDTGGELYNLALEIINDTLKESTPDLDRTGDN